jgi:hypothetical protein
MFLWRFTFIAVSSSHKHFQYSLWWSDEDSPVSRILLPPHYSSCYYPSQLQASTAPTHMIIANRTDYLIDVHVQTLFCHLIAHLLTVSSSSSLLSHGVMGPGQYNWSCDRGSRNDIAFADPDLSVHGPIQNAGRLRNFMPKSCGCQNHEQWLLPLNDRTTQFPPNCDKGRVLVFLFIFTGNDVAFRTRGSQRSDRPQDRLSGRDAH